jgi:hypothetical protein
MSLVYLRQTRAGVIHINHVIFGQLSGAIIARVRWSTALHLRRLTRSRSKKNYKGEIGTGISPEDDVRYGFGS